MFQKADGKKWKVYSNSFQRMSQISEVHHEKATLEKLLHSASSPKLTEFEIFRIMLMYFFWRLNREFDVKKRGFLLELFFCRGWFWIWWDLMEYRTSSGGFVISEIFCVHQTKPEVTTFSILFHRKVLRFEFQTLDGQRMSVWIFWVIFNGNALAR